MTIGGYVFGVADAAIVLLSFMGAVNGFGRGFAMGFSVRAGFLVGIAAALVFARSGAAVAMEIFGLPLVWATFVAYMALFVAGYISMMMLGGLLEGTLEALMLDWLDGLLGALLGVAEMLLVVAFAAYVLQLQSFVDLSDLLSASVIYSEILRPVAPLGIEIVREVVGGR